MINSISKAATTSGKGRLAAKKIETVDLDTLSLSEDGKGCVAECNSLDATGWSIAPETSGHKGEMVSPNRVNISDQEILKRFAGAKSICSDEFRSGSP